MNINAHQQKDKEYYTYRKDKLLSIEIHTYAVSHNSTHTLKAEVNMWVFKAFLKDTKVLQHLSDRGRSFHSFGAETEKALSPAFFNLELHWLKR